MSESGKAHAKQERSANEKNPNGEDGEESENNENNTDAASRANLAVDCFGVTAPSSANAEAVNMRAAHGADCESVLFPSTMMMPK